MKMSEMKEIAKPIIESGFKNKADEDDIKGAMVSAKIPFGKINSLFKTIAIELGLIRDPKDVKEDIEAQIVESDWESYDSWDQIQTTAEDIVAEVEGATEAQVISRIRSHYKDQGWDLPKKAKKATRSRGGKIAEAMADHFLKYPESTKMAMYQAMLPVSKWQRNAVDYTNAHYALYYALANKISLADAVAHAKGQEIPEKVEAGKEGEEASAHIE